MDCIVPEVARSQTQLNDFHYIIRWKQKQELKRKAGCKSAKVDGD